MNYEKAYKEAINKLDAVLNLKCVREEETIPVEDIRKIFPELKESEDEKIRKGLLSHLGELRDYKGTNAPIKTPEHYSAWIAWLENQKERSGLTKDEEFTLNRIIEHFEEEGGYDKWIEVLQDIRNIPYQKEQSRTITALEAWKEMRFEVYAQASANRHEPNYSDDNTKMFSLNDIDEIFEKISDCIVEQKPSHQMIAGAAKEAIFPEQNPVEWSEKDDKWAEEIRLAIKFYSNDEQFVVRLTNWFDNHVQPKQEWSEEDEKIRNGLIKGLTAMKEIYQHSTFSDDAINIVEAISWLKSFKPNNWKPSIEQIKALSSMLEYAPYSNYVQELRNLLDELKKLRDYD